MNLKSKNYQISKLNTNQLLEKLSLSTNEAKLINKTISKNLSLLTNKKNPNYKVNLTILKQQANNISLKSSTILNKQKNFSYLTFVPKKYFSANNDNNRNLDSRIKTGASASNNPQGQNDQKSTPEKFNKDIEKSQEEYDSDSEDQVSFYNQRKRMIYIFTSTCLIFIGMYLFLNYVKPEENVPLQKRLGQVTYIGSAKIGGPWKLYNTKGELVTHKDFTGKYYLIYFGFTQCPDVCPMSLQKIAKALNKIRQSKEYKYFDLECLFVSVDPDRDSYERIKSYCEIFNKNIIGLTGKSNDDPELKQMLKEFKIHSSKIYLTKEDEEIDRKNLERNVPEIVDAMNKVQPKSNMKYSLDHTIVTYLMGPSNNFITYLSANLNHEEMYNIILEGIMNDLSQKIKGVPVEKSKKL